MKNNNPKGKITRKKQILILISIISLLTAISFSLFLLHIKSSTTSTVDSQSDTLAEIYSSPDLGKNFYFDIDAVINEIQLPDLPSYPSLLTFYEYEPPQLNSIDDARSYLQNYSFDVIGYNENSDFSCGFKVFSFQNNSTYIGIAPNGLISITYNLSNLENKNQSISKEEAKKIADGYLFNHSMFPLSNYIWDVSGGVHTNLSTNISINTSFYIHYNQVVDSCSVVPGIYENKIMICIDARKAAIESIRFHWPDFNIYKQIDTSELIPIDELVQNFISKHNEDIKTNKTCKITNIDIIYSTPIHLSLREMDTDPLYLLCVPYIIVQWETGWTLLSPVQGT